jgi:phage recombination protein Bet
MATHQNGTAIEIVKFQQPRLPYDSRIEESFGINRGAWKALVEGVFPLAKSPDAVILALSYCRARNLDVFKKPVHIVPMWDGKQNKMVDTIWPSIAELRITAHRTNEYGGCDETEFGPMMTQVFEGEVTETYNGQKSKKHIKRAITFPEWARVTVYRMRGPVLCKFVGPRVKWLEAYATIGNSDVPNDMWTNRPEGQVEKCAEAGALRKAFPEECGNMPTAEEMEGRRLTLELSEQQSKLAPPAQTRARPQTLDDLASEETTVIECEDNAAPDAQEASQAAEPELAPAPTQKAPANQAALKAAFERGWEDQQKGISPKSVPAEFQSDKQLVAEWMRGLKEAGQKKT